MTIRLNPEMTINEVQEQFSALFPYLKIDFYTVPHDEGGSVWSKYQIFDEQKKLRDISPLSETKTYEITDTTTTGAFEQDLHQPFGLFVQVFRRSMDIWLATTATDKWALVYQNKVGESSAHSVTQMVYETRSLDEMD